LNRPHLQMLAEERIRDSTALLTASQWSGAYYLAGYALECALKSCVLHHVEQSGIIFDDKRFSEKCWTHDLELLVKLANLDVSRGASIQADPELGKNWLIAKDWSELSRYRLSTQQQSQLLYNAINDRTHGVLRWIRQNW